MKIKYQGGLTKLAACKISEFKKLSFSKLVDRNFSCFKANLSTSLVQIDIVSFSSKNDFYEQILSILSFLRYVGTPNRWTIYSDGSHTKQQIELLETELNFVKFISLDWKKEKEWLKNCKRELLPYKDYLISYANEHALGKRLFIYLNQDIKIPTLFLDSDILFYKKASIFNVLLNEKANGWYLPDSDWGCLDSRYIRNNCRQLYQVNGGFILLNKNLTNIAEGLEFLKSLNYNYEYFSEQTIMHIIIKANNFLPLDPRLFVLNSLDQFDFSYMFNTQDIAIRHYTGPVRHKMWQRDWKWHLSLT